MTIDYRYLIKSVYETLFNNNVADLDNLMICTTENDYTYPDIDTMCNYMISEISVLLDN